MSGTGEIKKFDGTVPMTTKLADEIFQSLPSHIKDEYGEIGKAMIYAFGKAIQEKKGGKDEHDA